MTDTIDQEPHDPAPFGQAFADFKAKTKRSDGLKRCEELCVRGTGTGICDTPLDDDICPNARGHLS